MKAEPATTWRGGLVGPAAVCVLAPNPGPMTLEGTNTWVLSTPRGAVVVDPGPADVPEHVAAVHARAGEVLQTWLTHHHRDHTGALAEWSALTGAPSRGAGHGRPWRDGEILDAGGLGVQVLRTPGHTEDSVCFLLTDHRLLLTGDTVLGRGTSVVPWPEGDLGDYLASLDRLIDLARSGQVERLAPGHGPAVAEPVTHLQALRDHRLQRLEQVRAALDAGAVTAADVVAAVYGDLEARLVPAATATVRAQLAYLGRPTD